MARPFDHARFTKAIETARRGDLVPLSSLLRTLVTAYGRKRDATDEARETAWAESFRSIGALLKAELVPSRVAAQIPKIVWRAIGRENVREDRRHRLVLVSPGDADVIDLDAWAGDEPDPGDVIAQADSLEAAHRLLDRLRDINPKHHLAFVTYLDGGGSAEIIVALRDAGFGTVTTDTANQYVSRARKTLQEIFQKNRPA